MIHKVRATYDGKALHPAEPLPIPPNTVLELSYEVVEEQEPAEEKPAEGRSFLDVALANPIEGPADWSQRVDYYLYGGMVDEEEE
ncbi:MAG TPA: hypothetical protein VF771_05145 [Longimicrobiaceae bacterium]